MTALRSHTCIHFVAHSSTFVGLRSRTKRFESLETLKKASMAAFKFVVRVPNFLTTNLL